MSSTRITSARHVTNSLGTPHVYLYLASDDPIINGGIVFLPMTPAAIEHSSASLRSLGILRANDSYNKLLDIPVDVTVTRKTVVNAEGQSSVKTVFDLIRPNDAAVEALCP